MQLRRRLLVLLYAAALSAVLAGSVAVYMVIIPNLFDLEEGTVKSEVRRVEAAFMQTLSTMHARARDWSERPDVRQLVAGESGQRPQAPSDALDPHGLDLVLVIDEQGRLRPHVRIFINRERVQELSARLAPDDDVQILQALSGG